MPQRSSPTWNSKRWLFVQPNAACSVRCSRSRRRVTGTTRRKALNARTSCGNNGFTFRGIIIITHFWMAARIICQQGASPGWPAPSSRPHARALVHRRWITSGSGSQRSVHCGGTDHTVASSTCSNRRLPYRLYRLPTQGSCRPNSG